MIKWRMYHRYVALAVTIPLIFIAVTGIILQLRNQFEWLQPASVSSTLTEAPLLTLDNLTTQYGAANIEQIIWRPGKKNMAVRLYDGTELQLHPQTGEILKSAKRRTNILIELHQGSWLGKFGQYFIYFISGLGLCFLIGTGLLIYPFKGRNIL